MMNEYEIKWVYCPTCGQSEEAIVLRARNNGSIDVCCSFINCKTFIRNSFHPPPVLQIPEDFGFIPYVDQNRRVAFVCDAPSQLKFSLEEELWWK